MVEHSPFKRLVLGSNPSAPTSFCKKKRLVLGSNPSAPTKLLWLVQSNLVMVRVEHSGSIL